MPSADHPTFVALLDTLIPPAPDRGLPGAGSLDIGAKLGQRAPGLLPLLDPLIEELDRQHFTGLGAEARSRAIDGLAPELAGLLGGLVFQAFAAYYERPEVVEALGLEARPPHPEGYPLEDGDLRGLARVMERGPLYRDA